MSHIPLNFLKPVKALSYQLYLSVTIPLPTHQPIILRKKGSKKGKNKMSEKRQKTPILTHLEKCGFGLDPPQVWKKSTLFMLFFGGFPKIVYCMLGFIVWPQKLYPFKPYLDFSWVFLIFCNFGHIFEKKVNKWPPPTHPLQYQAIKKIKKKRKFG